MIQNRCTVNKHVQLDKSGHMIMLFPTLLLTCRLTVHIGMIWTPAMWRNLTNLSRGSPFVSISATISSVGQCFSSTVPLFTCSRMKWYFISICFVRPWNCGFLDMLIADWLSSRITVGLAGSFFKSVVSCRTQIASVQHWPVPCTLLLQWIMPHMTVSYSSSWLLHHQSEIHTLK